MFIDIEIFQLMLTGVSEIFEIDIYADFVQRSHYHKAHNPEIRCLGSVVSKLVIKSIGYVDGYSSLVMPW
jgi:hypothetical protein